MMGVVQQLRLMSDWCHPKLLLEAAAEIERLEPYEAAIKRSHNGYNVDVRAVSVLEEPDTPQQAIDELIEEAGALKTLEQASYTGEIERLQVIVDAAHKAFDEWDANDWAEWEESSGGGELSEAIGRLKKALAATKNPPDKAVEQAKVGKDDYCFGTAAEPDADCGCNRCYAYFRTRRR